MSLLNSASLCVTPNGYKAGTLYSVIPNTTLGDMTVVRATTATRVNSAGLIESVANNVPRLDYSNGTCPSILVEPQRTNLVLYSEQFTNAAWTAGAFNVSITSNTTISPDGTQNAETVVFGAGGYLYQQFAITGLASATFSIYSKSATQIIIFGGATPAGTDVYTSVNVGNGWFRQILTRTFTSGGTGVLQTLPFGNNITAYVWGAQCELGSYPTSYIPTTSAAVTRNADAIYKTGISALIGQTEGVVFIDFVWNQLTGTGNYPRIIELGNNSNNYIQTYSISGTTSWGWDIYNGGVVQFSGSSTMALGHNKIAIGYKLNDMVIYKNGTLIASDATCTVPATNGLGICGVFDGTAGAQLSASVNSAILFPTRLTNAELASLTTL